MTRPETLAAPEAPGLRSVRPLAGGALARLEANVLSIFKGNVETVRLAIVSLLARGHMLIEDVPGVGKTTLAQALARSLGLSFQRIQFTSDLLPSDILGVSVYQQKNERFEFVPGPLFANVVLADEINRSTPKTQSALLEAMSERKVSIERQRLPLPDPFLVLATQNPHEYLGTFPLPESQLDRFEMSLRLGYPGRAAEKQLLLSGGVERQLEELPAVLSGDELRDLQQRVPQIRVAEKVADFVLQIAEATRTREAFQLGVSTRGALGLYRAAQALALLEGRDFVVPDDVQRLVGPVLAHRVVLRRGSSGLEAARRALDDVLQATPPPV
ncbi:MAG: AAA family ATPase [Thermoanaerobaculia bacterium]